MAVTLQQVAQEAGVSRAAASRVLSGSGAEAFAPATRRRIEEAAVRLGYRPNHTARALATGCTHLATLWICHPYQAFFAMVVEQVQRQAREHDYGLVVADVVAREPAGLGENSSAWPSDGILAMDCGPWADAVARARPAPDTPIVSMGTSVLQKTDHVLLDLTTGFREASRHLVAEGCRRIAYFSFVPPDEGRWPDPAFAGPRQAYCAAMRRAGLQEELVPLATPTRAAARQTIVEYVRRHRCPDGILCRSDDLAIGAYRAMCDLGIAVGEDVLLVGCDGIEDTQFLPCPLSTIVLPIPQMCELAWQFLEARLARPSIRPQEAVLETALEVRQSSQGAHR